MIENAKARRRRKVSHQSARIEKAGPADEPISPTPSSKSAQVRIADYVRLTLKGKTFEILHRKKPVAVLAPVGQLPEGMAIRQHVTTTEIARGKRTFANVIHHGPYLVTRDGKGVAVAYAPQMSTEPSLRELRGILDTFRDKLEYLEVLDEARKRRLELRLEADRRISVRMDILRRSGDNSAADAIGAELAEIQRKEDAGRIRGG